MARRNWVVFILASLIGIGLTAVLATTTTVPSAAGQDATTTTVSAGDSTTSTTTAAPASSDSSPSVNIIGAPQGLTDAVEALYLEALTGGSGDAATLASASENLVVTGLATTAEAYGGYVGVVVASDDTILAVSDDGESWEVVEADLQSVDFELLANPEPRFVVLIGADAADPGDPELSRADSIHIYGVDPTTKTGAIVGIPRDTAMAYNGPSGPRVEDGMAEISHTMRNLGPDVTTDTIANETGLPIEGWFVTGFGTPQTGTPGFEDLVDVMGGIDFLDIPYAAPSQCNTPPPPANPDVGDTHIDGAGALAFSRERKCIPTQYLGPVAYTSNAVRTLSQGLLMKAAVEMVQQPGILALPALLDIMDDFVLTNLVYDDVFSLASTLYGDPNHVGGVDPGPMPTFGPADLATRGYDAYNLNPGNLPNVVVEGCNGYLWRNEDVDPPTTNFNQFYNRGNYGTFVDFADGKLDMLPTYTYNSGNATKPYSCPTFLPTSVTRLAGANRYDTAVEISKSMYWPGVAVTYVATGLNFPDALSAGPVAALNLGPILLVKPGSIPSATKAELSRLKPGRIVILGGTAAVSASVESQLNGYTSGGVTRLAGSNRYATAAAISDSMFSPGVPVVHISTGLNFPDALAMSPGAALNGGPILLVKTDSIPSQTRTELKRLKPGRIVIVGGTAAVSASVESQLDGYTSGGVTRLAESNRYSTAAEISKAKIPAGVNIAYVSTGVNFPDALAGGPVAGYSGSDVSPIGLGASPILLVRKDSIPSATRTELTRLQPHFIVILGGSAVVSDKVQSALEAYLVP